VHAQDRAAAIARMERSLAGIGVEGIQTTIPFLKTVITQPEFREGKTHVRWIEALLSRSAPA